MKTNKLTIASMIIALIALMGLVPWIGFINVGVIAITLVHIPVILGSVVMDDYKYAFLFGLSFGVVSWIANLYTPSPSQPLFFNPLIAVLPRLFVGLSAVFFYRLSQKVCKKKAISMAVAGIFGAVTNTFLVLSCIGLFGTKDLAGAIKSAIQIVISVNGSLEIVLAAILVPIIATPILKYQSKH